MQVADKKGSFTMDIESDCTVVEFKQRICDKLAIETTLPDGFSTHIE